MRFTLSVAVLVGLALLALVPAARADPISVSAQPVFDRLGHAVIQPPNTTTRGLTDEGKGHHGKGGGGGDDGDPTVPEPGPLLSLVLFASGLWFIQRRRVLRN
jgi:hypothetical protein